MIKLGFGIVILILIGFIAYQVRKQIKTEKLSEQRRVELEEAKDRLKDRSMTEDVLNVEEAIVKKDKHIKEREEKIARKRAKLEDSDSDA